jgi:hypothetical protein
MGLPCGQVVGDARRDRVLEAMGLLVNVRPINAEDVDEEPLSEPMAAHHGFGERVAGLREDDFLLRGDLDQAVASHAMQCGGDGWGSDLQRLRKARGDHGSSFTGDGVNVEEVVLNRFGGAILTHGLAWHTRPLRRRAGQTQPPPHRRMIPPARALPAAPEHA